MIKSGGYVLDIIIGLFLCRCMTDKWIKSDAMC